MSIDVGAPSRGLLAVLNPNGTWDQNNIRSGGTFPGTIRAANCYEPTFPLDGPFPAIFISNIPAVSTVVIEGAGTWCHNGTLAVAYLDRLSEESGVPLAILDRTMSDNCSAIISAILKDLHLSNSVMAVTQPIEVIRDPEGLTRQFQGSPFIYCEMHVTFLGIPSTP